ILILFTGIVVLSLSEKWYYSAISEPLAFVITTVAVFSGTVLKVLSVKWRKFLFGFACLFTLTGILFTILGFVLNRDREARIVFQVFACASWCCVMLIAIFWATWYLRSRSDPSEYSTFFIIFTVFYEHSILNIILKLVFTVTGCV
ncbi:hypothetical protein KSF78_0008215, partial [Schistosoma japonicum]